MASKTPVIFEFPEQYPEAMEQMGQIIGRAMLKLGLKEPQAQQGAFEAMEGIRAELGGAFFYVNKGVSYDLLPRDKEIWDEFNGRNYFHLSQKHKLSEMQIRNIINEMRAREMAKRQGQLPGFDAS